MKNATRNDYNAISALVFDQENHIGSACLLWSEDKEHLYCITADHCTHKDGIEYDIHIKYHYNGELKEFKIKKDKLSDSTNDVAIFELEYKEYVDIIPYTLTSDLLVPPKYCCINGYPQKNKTERSAISAEFISKNNDGRIDLNIPHLDNDSYSRYDEIIGISGSGCYEVVGNNIKFFGIENKSLNRDVPFKEVHCVPLPTINCLLKCNNKAELPKPIPSYITRRIGKGYVSVNEVLRKYSLNNTWTEISITDSIIKNVQTHFTNNANSTLFVCGLSGIGKTRSVLMACTKKGFENTLYYENFSGFKEDLLALKKYTEETNEILNIIVDEAQVKDWNYVNDELNDRFQYFRIIFIGTISKNQYSNDKNFIYISTCVEDDVKKIVEAQYPLFTPEEVQCVYNLSYNDLRLAMLISRLHNDDKKQELNTNVMVGRATQLYDKYSSAKGILERTIEQKRLDVPKDIDLNYYFERLSLFVDIGYKGRAVVEIDALSDFFNIDKSDFKRAVEHLANVELGIKKEDYFELCPRALAKLAFEESGWDRVKYKIDNFMNFIPSDLMRRRFFDRVDECSMSKEVNEALASWFCRKYVTSDLNVLDYTNVLEAMMFVEHNPEIGLKWLKDVINTASDVEIQSFGKIINTCRRHVVWTCEHLANFKEHFGDCEEILFKLAKNECEMWISNNSQGVWSSYFSMFLANTEVSFFERYDLLIKRAVECTNEKDINLFKKAFSTVFTEGNIRWLPPKMIGGVITPHNWEPKTIDDLLETKIYALYKLLESFGELEIFIQEIIIETISENMRTYIDYNLLIDYKETMDAIIKTQLQKNELILNIENQIKFLEYHNNDNEIVVNDNIEILKRWIEELKDNSLIGRLNEYLSRSIWSYGYTDEEKKKAEDLICGICKEFILLPDKIDIIKKIVSSTNFNKEAIKSFAEHLALYDKELDLFEIIIYISNNKFDNNFLQGYYSGAYKIINVLPDKLIIILDEIASVNPDFVIWASTIFDVSDNGYKRIISLLDITNFLNVIENMKYKEWYTFLSVQRKIELCNELSNCDNKLKYIICFDLFHGWIFQGQNGSSIYDKCIQIFEKCLGENSRFEIHVIIELFKMFPKGYQNRVIKLLISLFDFNEVRNEKNSYISDYIVSIKDEYNEFIIMEEIGAKLILSDKSLKGPAMRGFFDRFSLKAIRKWIEEEPTERAALIAYHLASPNLETREMTLLTKYILSEYENDKKVYENFIFGEYNFVVYTPEDYYAKKEEWYELLKEYEDSPLARVRQWAEYEKNRIEAICMEHKSFQAEKSRYE